MNLKEEIKSQLEKVIKELGIKNVEISLEIPPDESHGDYTSNVAMQIFGSVKRQASSVKYTSPFELAKDIASRLTVNGLPFAKAEALAPGFINFWISPEVLIKNLSHVIAAKQSSHPERSDRVSHKALAVAQGSQSINRDSSQAQNDKNEEIASSFTTPRNDSLEGKKISVEFTDPNPFKEFHIGHLYSNTVGESICRLLEFQGAIVWRADYFGDVGMHVAKSLWGLEKKFEEDKINLEDLANKPLRARIQYLGQAYAKGATAYEEDDDIKEEMRAINRLVFIAAQKMWEKEKGIIPQIDYKKDYDINPGELQKVFDLYTTGRSWSLEYFDSIYARLDMRFDGYYPESIAGEKGYRLVKDNLKDGIFAEHDGAIIFRGEEKGLHTRVFINSLGFPTYEAKELGLAPWKYEEFKYDRSIIITGNEINEYFKVLIAAMLEVEPELGKKTEHISHGMVRLPEGKMSSRTGKILTGEWLLDEAVERAKKIAKTSDRTQIGLSTSDKTQKISKSENRHIRHSDVSDSTDILVHRVPSEFHLEIAEQVGIAAVKYAFLKSGIGKDVEFDFDASLSFEGNSGPYIQYSYVRTQSILEKVHFPDNTQIGFSKSDNQNVRNSDRSDTSEAPVYRVPSEYHPNPDELTLLRKIAQFNEIVTQAAENLAPSMVCNYLFELAKTFSYFYQNNRILEFNEIKNSRHPELDSGSPEGIPGQARNDKISKETETFRISLTSAVGKILARGLYLLGIEAPKRM